MGDMDQGIKRLLQSHPREVLQLALPDAEYLGPMPVDVAAEPQLIMDTLQRIRRHGVECAVDFEAEAYPSAEMPRRCYEYGTRASIVHQLPVYSVVLWLLERGNVPMSPYELRVGPDSIATWHFSSIELYRLQGKPIVDAQNFGLLPLIPFMADRDVGLIERSTHMVKDAHLPEEEEIVSLLALFTSIIYHDKDLARSIVRRVYMSTDILDMSPLWQEAVGVGEQKGELRSKREDIRLILESRFGALDAELIRAIDVADLATLRALFRQTLTASLEAIRNKLMPTYPAPNPDTME